MTRSPLFLLLWLVAATVWPALANAQSARDTAAARQQFRAGLAAAERGRWEEARDAFLRSDRLAARPATRFNLALARIECGELVEASEGLRAFLRDARDARYAAYRERSERELAALETRIPSLRIEIVGDPSGVTLTLDQVPLLDDAVGIAIPINPGAHILVATRGGEEVGRAEIDVTESSEETVALTVSGRIDALRPSLAPAEGSGLDETLVWALAIGAGALVVGALATGIGVAATSEAPGPPLFEGSLGTITID